ncbi:hypothetical protein NX059_008183 [Plenodomus lindquistii]|nr:hypothetical protein NX059_008183 [Plenodomus lindquistii]
MTSVDDDIHSAEESEISDIGEDVTELLDSSDEEKEVMELLTESHDEDTVATEMLVTADDDKNEAELLMGSDEDEGKDEPRVSELMMISDEVDVVVELLTTLDAPEEVTKLLTPSTCKEEGSDTEELAISEIHDEEVAGMPVYSEGDSMAESPLTDVYTIAELPNASVDKGIANVVASCEEVVCEAMPIGANEVAGRMEVMCEMAGVMFDVNDSIE